MLEIDVVVKIENPVEVRLEVIDFDVVISQQALGGGLLLHQVVHELSLGVEGIPLHQRIRRKKEDELRLRMRLDEGEKVVFHVEPRLLREGGMLFKRRLRDLLAADDRAVKHRLRAEDEILAPAVHRVPLGRIGLPEGAQALGDVLGQHAPVEPVLHVVERLVIIQIGGHLGLWRLVEERERIDVQPVEDGFDFMAGKRHLHHLPVVERRAAVDAELDKAAAQRRVQLAGPEVLRHRGADDDAVVVVGLGDAGVGIALRPAFDRRDERRRLVIDLEGIDEDDQGDDQHERADEQGQRQASPLGSRHECAPFQ